MGNDILDRASRFMTISEHYKNMESLHNSLHERYGIIVQEEKQPTIDQTAVMQDMIEEIEELISGTHIKIKNIFLGFSSRVILTDGNVDNVIPVVSYINHGTEILSQLISHFFNLDTELLQIARLIRQDIGCGGNLVIGGIDGNQLSYDLKIDEFRSINVRYDGEDIEANIHVGDDMVSTLISHSKYVSKSSTIMGFINRFGLSSFPKHIKTRDDFNKDL